MLIAWADCLSPLRSMQHDTQRINSWGKCLCAKDAESQGRSASCSLAFISLSTMVNTAPFKVLLREENRTYKDHQDFKVSKSIKI